MFNNKANYIKHILLMLIMENIKQIYKYYLLYDNINLFFNL